MIIKFLKKIKNWLFPWKYYCGTDLAEKEGDYNYTIYMRKNSQTGIIEVLGERKWL